MPSARGELVGRRCLRARDQSAHFLEAGVEHMVRLVDATGRCEPASGADQSCHSFHLAVTPPAEVYRYQDGFGNRVHHFNLLSASGQVRILAASDGALRERMVSFQADLRAQALAKGAALRERAGPQAGPPPHG